MKRKTPQVPSCLDSILYMLSVAWYWVVTFLVVIIIILAIEAIRRLI